MFLFQVKPSFFSRFPLFFLFPLLIALSLLPTATFAQARAFLGGNACFVETTGDNVTDHASADETALQDAVNAAGFGALLKVAGTCAGTHAQGGRILTVYVSQTLTIQGGYEADNWLVEPNPTTHPTTLNALQEGRVVFVNTGGYAVTLRGLILTGGESTNGGAIENRSTVTLIETNVSDNTVTGSGGAIFNQGGTVILTDSTLSGNSASVSGGGIYSASGAVTLNSSQLTNNSATSDGGGIYATGSSSITLLQSTLNNNTATAEGGGIYHEATGLVTLTQSALYNNTAGTQGGGIYLTAGLVNITNSTLSANQANGITQGGGAIAMTGGSAAIQYTTLAGNATPFISGQDGIWLNAGTMTVSSSILGFNGTENCFVAGGSLTSNGYNLSSDSSCSFNQMGDQINTNPNLGALVNNGGPTLSHLLLPFSPAIDAIPNNSNNCGTTVITDQRGLTRPVDGTCDKGAVELSTNYVPTAAPDSHPLNEDGSLTVPAPGVLANDTDGDWDSLTAVLNTDVSHGTLTFNANGSFNYVPAQNYCGTDAFTYHAEDGQNSSAITSVTLNINCLNDLPVAEDDVYETLEDTPLNVAAPGVLVNDQDPDNNPLTAIPNTQPTQGTLTLNANGSFTYTPDDDTCGADSFTYFANDGSANSNLSTVFLTIPCVNDPPVTVGETYETVEDTPLAISSPGILANDTDVEQDPLTAILSLPPAHGTLTLNPDGSFAFTPAEDFCGTDFFTYYANDGTDNSNQSAVNFTLTCVNDIPEADAGTDQTVEEGDGVVFSGTFIDPDNLGLEISWDFGDGSGATGTLTPVHVYPDEGTFTVTLIITDDQGTSGSDLLIVTILNVPPSFGGIVNQTVALGEIVDFTVDYHDPGVFDTHTATINWRDGTLEAGELDPGEQTISGNHLYALPGVYSVLITVQDNAGDETSATLIITVLAEPRRYSVYLPVIVR